jgi:hypothetical protein
MVREYNSMDCPGTGDTECAICPRNFASFDCMTDDYTGGCDTCRGGMRAYQVDDDTEAELMSMQDVVMDKDPGGPVVGGNEALEIAPYRVRIELIETVEEPDEVIESEQVTAATIYYEDGRPLHITLESEDEDNDVGGLTVSFDFLEMVRDTARQNGKHPENGPAGAVMVRGYY